MTNKLVDLIKKIEEEATNPFVIENFYQQAKEKPENYNLLKIGERKESRKIGRDNIPKKEKLLLMSIMSGMNYKMLNLSYNFQNLLLKKLLQ